MQALVIIDMQEGFRSPESEAIIPHIQQAQKQFEHFFFAQFINASESPFEKLLLWNALKKQSQQEIMSEFTSKKVFTHNTYSVLTEKLKQYFATLGVTQVYIAGVYTDVCVSHFAMQLFDAGYEPFVFADCCASLHGATQHDAALVSLSHIIGKKRIVRL